MSPKGPDGSLPDAAIIGGGIIGCSIALRLANAKLKVTVFDRGEPGAEASSAAAGMLAPQSEGIEPQAFEKFCTESRDLYSGFAAEIEDATGEDVGYRHEGALLVATGDEDCKELEELFHSQTRKNLPIERLTSDDLRARIPGFFGDVRMGLFVPGDHWVDNERLARALAKACQRAGVTFSTGVEVTGLSTQKDRVEGVEIRQPGSTATGSVSAGNFILAAGCWSQQIASSLRLAIPVVPCHGQMMELESSTKIPMIVRSGMQYLVPRSNRRVAAGTTAEYIGFEKHVTAGGLQSILGGITRFAPGVRNFRFLRAWSGLRPDTQDHLPILGTGEFESLVFATGHFRNGILLAPLTGQLISELILTRTTSLPLDLYSPLRFNTPA